MQAEGVTVGDKGKDCLPFENKIRPVIKGGPRTKEKNSCVLGDGLISRRSFRNTYEGKYPVSEQTR